MDEANHRLQQIPTPNQAQRQVMDRAVMTLAHREAIKAVKRQFQRQGLKLSHFPHKVIAAEAEQYLAQHRAELIAQAIEIVERWHAEGMFGPRGGIRTRSRS
jgi:hypothetical protein